MQLSNTDCIPAGNAYTTTVMCVVHHPTLGHEASKGGLVGGWEGILPLPIRGAAGALPLARI